MAPRVSMGPSSILNLLVVTSPKNTIEYKPITYREIRDFIKISVLNLIPQSYRSYDGL